MRVCLRGHRPQGDERSHALVASRTRKARSRVKRREGHEVDGYTCLLAGKHAMPPVQCGSADQVRDSGPHRIGLPGNVRHCTTRVVALDFRYVFANFSRGSTYASGLETRLRARWVLALAVGCGGVERAATDASESGSTHSVPRDATTSEPSVDAGADARERDSAADAPTLPDAPSLSPASDGGGQAVTCVPDTGPFVFSPYRYPASTFADTTACTSDGECGCG